MTNYGIEKRADTSREDLQGIGELLPEGLTGGKIVAKVQPAPAGEQAHADVGTRSTTPGRSQSHADVGARSTSSTPRNRIVPETSAVYPAIPVFGV